MHIQSTLNEIRISSYPPLVNRTLCPGGGWPIPLSNTEDISRGHQALCSKFCQSKINVRPIEKYFPKLADFGSGYGLNST